MTIIAGLSADFVSLEKCIRDFIFVTVDSNEQKGRVRTERKWLLEERMVVFRVNLDCAESGHFRHN